jgi:hypothetical protein
MKSEERHHLHENDLAQILERWMGKVEPYSNQILIGVLAVAVIGIGGMLWSRSSQAKSAQGWAEFAKANSADDFATVADVHPSSDVGRWSKLLAAELYLNQGLQSATADKKTTDERLKQSEESFNQLLQDQATSAAIRERALFGLAVCRETSSGADTQPAITTYEELLKAFPDSRFSTLAKRRIDELRTEQAREWYAWFSQQERNPEDRPVPRDLATGRTVGESAPPFLIDDTQPPPQRHEDRPPSPRLPIPGAYHPGETAPAFPSLDAPAPSTTSPPTTTPANESPAATTPQAAPAAGTTPESPPPSATDPASPASPTEPSPPPAP